MIASNGRMTGSSSFTLAIRGVPKSVGSSGDGNLDRGGIHRLHDQKLRWFTGLHKSAPHTFWYSPL